MKNPAVLIGFVVVLAVVGVGFFTFTQKSSEPESMMKSEEMSEGGVKEELMEDKKSDSMMKKDENTASEDDKMMNNNVISRYFGYSKSLFDAASDKRRVLFFYASWCPTCRPADANLKENESKIPEDMVVIRVNYNDPDTDQEEKDLAKKYGVTYQHTFVQIDENGQQITKWNGGMIDELLKNIK